MNRTDFLNMITGTYPVNRQMLSEVYDLIEIFPYFQSAHMLLLKGLQNCGDVKFENQLRNSAIHIADREVLYYLFNTKISPVVEQPEKKTDISATEDLDYETQQVVIESATNSERLISEFEEGSGDAKTDAHQDSLLNTHVHSILISTEADNNETAGMMLMNDVEPPQNDDKIVFMDPGILIPETGDLLELDIDETGQDFAEDIIESPAQFKNEEINSKKQLQAELIDKFIVTNPRIEPNKDKSDSPAEDISQPFVEERGGFFTETLARIYVNQGYYSKAIDIYEKLSLKFPEKSSYFASQIEKVKEYIKK
jgi:hypothetical protein